MNSDQREAKLITKEDIERIRDMVREELNRAAREDNTARMFPRPFNYDDDEWWETNKPQGNSTTNPRTIASWLANQRKPL